MPGDVGDENAKMISFERQEIVEIPRNGAHGKITRCDFNPRVARNFTRKNGCLNLFRDFQLFLNSKEAFFLGNNSMGYKIAEGVHQKEKADRFDVAPRKNAKTGEVCTENEKAENAQAQGDNAEFRWEAAGRAKEKKKDGQKNPGRQDEDCCWRYLILGWRYRGGPEGSRWRRRPIARPESTEGYGANALRRHPRTGTNSAA